MPSSVSSSTVNGQAQSIDLTKVCHPDPNVYSKGYRRLSGLMSANPEHALFRKSGSLNALNLLYIQTEIHQLEKELQRSAEMTAFSQNEDERSKDYRWSSLAALDANGDHSDQYQLVLKLRRLSKTYNKQLLIQAQIKQLKSPVFADVRWWRSWMFHNDNGTVWLKFEAGHDQEVFPNAPERDYMALKARDYVDSLTNWYATRLVVIFDHYIGRFIWTYEKDSIIEDVVFRPHSNDKWLSAITAALAAAFPVLSIVVLNQCKSVNLSLGVLAIFTISFAVLLSLVSPKKRLEVFGASAAFAAVNVVFIRN